MNSRLNTDHFFSIILALATFSISLPLQAQTDGQTIFVPVVLSAPGMNGSFFTSEMTMTHRGTQTASMNFTYTAAFGEGSGTGTDILTPGQQRIVPDAIAYLRSIGIPIPVAGGQGGTLSISFSGLSSPADVAVTVRTTTAVD